MLNKYELWGKAGTSNPITTTDLGIESKKNDCMNDNSGRVYIDEDQVRKDKLLRLVPLKPKYVIQCLICDETVELSETENSCLNYGLFINPKICDKCKQAILYARRMMENQED